MEMKLLTVQEKKRSDFYCSSLYHIVRSFISTGLIHKIILFSLYIHIFIWLTMEPIKNLSCLSNQCVTFVSKNQNILFHLILDKLPGTYERTLLWRSHAVSCNLQTIVTSLFCRLLVVRPTNKLPAISSETTEPLV